MFPSPEHLATMLIDVMEAYGWKSAYVLYNKQSEFYRCIEAMENIVTTRRWYTWFREVPAKVATQADRDSVDAILSDVRTSGRIHVVMMTDDDVIDAILEQAFHRMLLTSQSHWIITSFDASQKQLDSFRHSGARFTLLRQYPESATKTTPNWSDPMLTVGNQSAPHLNRSEETPNRSDPERTGETPSATELDRFELGGPGQNLSRLDRCKDSLSNTARLARDSVAVLADLLSSLEEQDTNRPSEGWRTLENCSRQNQSSKVTFRGASGDVSFDDCGRRTDVTIYIREYSDGQEKQVGFWTADGAVDMNTTISYVQMNGLLGGRHFQVFGRLSKPWIMERKHAEAEGLRGRHRYEGFMLDLTDMLAARLNFTWNLTMGANYKGAIESGEYDLVLFPMSMRSHRLKTMQLSIPLRTRGYFLTMKKSDRRLPGMFQFMAPFSKKVWLCFVAAIVSVSLVLSVNNRFNPNSSKPVHLPPLGSSDHQVLVLPGTPWVKEPVFVHRRRKCTPETVRSLGLALNLADFSPVENTPHAEEKVHQFYSILRPLLDSLLPFKRGKVTSRDKEWITPRIKGLIRERQKAFMSGDTTSFKRLRNKIQHYMKSAKRSFYEKEVDHLKHGDTRKWYSLVKSLMGAPKKREGSLPTPGIDCDSLSEHFSSVWSNVTRDIPSTADVSDQLSTGSLPELSIGQVKLQLRKLNPRKATGDDHIPIWILTTFHEELAPVLCNIYNSCLQQGIFPEQWKSELVVPVPKTSKPKGPEEYRRISLTSCLGKVLESFVRVLLQRDTDHLIHGSQHGFRPGRSTVSALNHITQTWHDALNNKPKMDVHVSFIDFSRAFDTIDHGSLLHSLAIMGVRRDLWCCLRSYLSDRVQRVRWGSRVSSPRPVLAGTPQGGIISPSLFVLAMNSLDKGIPISVAPVKYADDLTNTELLMGSLPGQMQPAINEVDSWAKSYSMAANVKKTKDMVISCRKEAVNPPPLTLNGERVERVRKFKLLGVIVSDDLSWGPHIDYILSKVRPRLHYLRLSKRAGLPADVLLDIYKAFIRPVLEYGSPVWGGLPRGLAEELEKVQRSCCRIISIPYEQLPTLESRRREATTRELRRVVADPTHPCHQFLQPATEFQSSKFNEWGIAAARGAVAQDQADNLNLPNSLWSTWGAAVGQGPEFLPRSYAGRVAAGTWWFFVLVAIASYTANLAAFLSQSSAQQQIKTLSDLAEQTDVPYGTYDGYSIVEFFQQSQEEPFKTLGKYLTKNADEVLTVKSRQAMDRAIEGNYIFISPTTYEYEILKERCDMVILTAEYFFKYQVALPFPLESPYVSEVNLALMKMAQDGEMDVLENRWFNKKKDHCKSDAAGATGVLGMDNFGGLFYFLVMGMGGAMAVFFVEWIWFMFRPPSDGSISSYSETNKNNKNNKNNNASAV
ncbi:uncharacterized protein [Branchiostoma lanceolatum]|uniref:uncharacterized protein n=1 Tax=Branchiostoma lanceolatum TaxID=7740 RepID=UPI003455010C